MLVWTAGVVKEGYDRGSAWLVVLLYTFRNSHLMTLRRKEKQTPTLSLDGSNWQSKWQRGTADRQRSRWRQEVEQCDAFWQNWPYSMCQCPQTPNPTPWRGTSCGWGRVDRGGWCGNDSDPKWHLDQTLSVSWPFPFTFSVCACLLKISELPQKRQEEISKLRNEEPEAVCMFYTFMYTNKAAFVKW